MEIIINSIRINTEKVKIDYKEIDDRGSRDVTIDWKHKPRKSFSDALQALADHVIEISEFPKDWNDQIVVRGISFSYEEETDRLGAVIMATRTLKHSNAPLNITTPYKLEPNKDVELKGDSKIFLTSDCIRIMNLLRDEAEEYLEGKHAADNQEDMFKGKKKEDKPPKTDPKDLDIKKPAKDKSKK